MQKKVSDFLLKTSKKILNLSYGEFEFEEAVVVDEETFYFIIYINIESSDYSNVKGSFHFDGNEDPVIEIDIFKSDEPFLFSEIVNCLFHEYRHFCQKDKDLCSHYSNTLEYFTCESELDAYSFGFLVESVLFGQDIEDVIDRYLNNYKKIMSECGINIVKDMWISKSKQILLEEEWITQLSL